MGAEGGGALRVVQAIGVGARVRVMGRVRGRVRLEGSLGGTGNWGRVRVRLGLGPRGLWVVQVCYIL